MDTLTVLREARAVITPFEKWSSNIPGHEWGWGREEDETACAVGACAVVVTGRCVQYEKCQPALDALAAAMDVDPKPHIIADWNDNHTHAEVLAAFDRAIAAEEAKLTPTEVVPQAIPRRRDDVGCETRDRVLA